MTANTIAIHNLNLNITVFKQHYKLPIKSRFGEKKNQHVLGRFFCQQRAAPIFPSTAIHQQLLYSPPPPPPTLRFKK